MGFNDAHDGMGFNDTRSDVQRRLEGRPAVFRYPHPELNRLTGKGVAAMIRKLCDLRVLEKETITTEFKENVTVRDEMRIARVAGWEIREQLTRGPFRHARPHPSHPVVARTEGCAYTAVSPFKPEASDSLTHKHLSVRRAARRNCSGSVSATTS
jgi:hypothetical protein